MPELGKSSTSIFEASRANPRDESKNARSTVRSQFAVHTTHTVITGKIQYRNALNETRYQLGMPSPLLTRSQNLVSRHTRPTPRLSSARRTCSWRSVTSLLHLLAIHFLSPSLSLSFSIALRVATRLGATCTPASPGTHSGGNTARLTSASGDGRAASRRDRRMETRERAKRRDTTEVLVMKMEREMRSASEGRDGEYRSGGRMTR